MSAGEPRLGRAVQEEGALWGRGVEVRNSGVFWWGGVVRIKITHICWVYEAPLGVSRRTKHLLDSISFNQHSGATWGCGVGRHPPQVRTVRPTVK